MKRKEGDLVGVATFICYLPKVKSSTRGRFKCFCGNIFDARIGDVRRGNLGCGCRKHGEGHPCYKHGHSHRTHATLTYNSWKAAINRCHRPKHKKFDYYGGVGISVCDRWRYSFENFLEDMGERPSKQHSLDRYPNKSGNYEPGNCRWATRKEQIENRDCTIYITFMGKKMTLIDWSLESGVNRNTLRQRYYNGFEGSDLFNQPCKPLREKTK